MSAIPAAELASITSDLFSYADKSCEVRRYTRIDDDEGGSSETWATIATVPCLVIDAISPAEQVVASQVLGRVGKKILMPPDTDVVITDQLRVDGVTFRIIGVYDPSSIQVSRSALVTQEVQ